MKSKKNKHKPPSRIKYEKNNPVFSARMPIEWHDKLKKYRKETSYSNTTFLGIALGKIVQDYEGIYKKGYNEGKKIGLEDGENQGYANGMNDYNLDMICWRCRKPIFIKRGTWEYNMAKERLRNDICHEGCHL